MEGDQAPITAPAPVQQKPIVPVQQEKQVPQVQQQVVNPQQVLPGTQNQQIKPIVVSQQQIPVIQKQEIKPQQTVVQEKPVIQTQQEKALPQKEQQVIQQIPPIIQPQVQPIATSQQMKQVPIIQQEIPVEKKQEMKAQTQIVQEKSVAQPEKSVTPIIQQSPLIPIDQVKPQTAPQKEQTQIISSTEEQKSSTIPSLLKLSQNDMKAEIMKSVGKSIVSKKGQQVSQSLEKQSLTEVRNDFLLFLAKIYDNNTREDGVKGCHRIIFRYSDNPQMLKVILTALCDRSAQAAQEPNPNGLMFHAQIFGYLAKNFKRELIDPTDKPPSLVRTVQKIQEAIIGFFKDGNKLVWRGCGLSLTEILDSCFPDKDEVIGNGINSVASLFIDPLIKILSVGADKVSQQGAAYCIKHLIEHFVSQDYQNMIDQVGASIIQTAAKYKVDTPEMIQCVILLIDHLSIKIASSNISDLINISLKILSTPNQNNQVKKFGCDLLATLAQHLVSVADLIVPQYQTLVMNSLASLNNEKLNILIEARNNASRAWEQLEKSFQNMHPAKKVDLSNLISQSFQGKIAKEKQSISNMQENKLSVMRDIQKQNKDLQQRQASEDPSRKVDFCDPNLSSKLQAQDFLKKGKGQGGGNSSSPQITRERAIYDDLSRIQEAVQHQRGISPSVNDNGDLRSHFMNAMRGPQQMQQPVNVIQQKGIQDHNQRQIQEQQLNQNVPNKHIQPPQSLNKPIQNQTEGQNSWVPMKQQQMDQNNEQRIANNQNQYKQPIQQNQNYIKQQDFINDEINQQRQQLNPQQIENQRQREGQYGNHTQQKHFNEEIEQYPRLQSPDSRINNTRHQQVHNLEQQMSKTSANQQNIQQHDISPAHHDQYNQYKEQYHNFDEDTSNDIGNQQFMQDNGLHKRQTSHQNNEYHYFQQDVDINKSPSPNTKFKSLEEQRKQLKQRELEMVSSNPQLQKYQPYYQQQQEFNRDVYQIDEDERDGIDESEQYFQNEGNDYYSNQEEQSASQYQSMIAKQKHQRLMDSLEPGYSIEKQNRNNYISNQEYYVTPEQISQGRISDNPFQSQIYQQKQHSNHIRQEDNDYSIDEDRDNLGVRFINDRQSYEKSRKYGIKEDDPDIDNSDEGQQKQQELKQQQQNHQQQQQHKLHQQQPQPQQYHQQIPQQLNHSFQQNHQNQQNNSHQQNSQYQQHQQYQQQPIPQKQLNQSHKKQETPVFRQEINQIRQQTQLNNSHNNNFSNLSSHQQDQTQKPQMRVDNQKEFQIRNVQQPKPQQLNNSFNQNTNKNQIQRQSQQVKNIQPQLKQELPINNQMKMEKAHSQQDLIHQQQIAQMISQQILLMQKQMEKGFVTMHDKIQTIEGRVNSAAMQLEDYEKQRTENEKINQQKEKENQQLFRMFSESINAQQLQIQDAMSKGFTADYSKPNMNSSGDHQILMKQKNGNQTQNLLHEAQYPQSKSMNNRQEAAVDFRREEHQRDNRWVQGDDANHHQSTRQARSPRSKQSKITTAWVRSMELVKKRQYEDAYRLILKEGDDMYLLRLVAQTGPVVKFLDDQTSITIINRINKIVRSGAFENMEIEWLEDANRRGLFGNLTKYEQNEYLDTLFQFSKSKINPKTSEKASQVYQQIKITNMNTNNNLNRQ